MAGSPRAGHTHARTHVCTHTELASYIAHRLINMNAIQNYVPVYVQLRSYIYELLPKMSTHDTINMHALKYLAIASFS